MYLYAKVLKHRSKAVKMSYEVNKIYKIIGSRPHLQSVIGAHSYRHSNIEQSIMFNFDGIFDRNTQGILSIKYNQCEITLLDRIGNHRFYSVTLFELSEDQKQIEKYTGQRDLRDDQIKSFFYLHTGLFI